MPGLGGSDLQGDGVSGPPLSVSEYPPPREAAVGEPEPSAGIQMGQGTCLGLGTQINHTGQHTWTATGVEPWVPGDRAPP